MTFTLRTALVRQFKDEPLKITSVTQTRNFLSTSQRQIFLFHILVFFKDYNRLYIHSKEIERFMIGEQEDNSIRVEK